MHQNCSSFRIGGRFSFGVWRLCRDPVHELTATLKLLDEAKMIDFPATGYVVFISHLDTFIDIRTEVCTGNHRYCAGLLVGLTNYNIQIGDILAWNHQREVFWYPEIEEMDEPWKMLPRKLFLVRVLSQVIHSV
jgi:hypothetical protein